MDSCEYSIELIIEPLKERIARKLQRMDDCHSLCGKNRCTA